MEAFSRTELLLGKQAMEKLKNATVAVFGLGGVGGYTLEALARSGVGNLVLVDHDTISLTNINRQLLATRSTVGMDKVEAARQRVLDIDPSIRVTVRKEFYGPDTAATFDFSQYDYVVDAIDTVTGKLALVQAAQAAGTPLSAVRVPATSWTLPNSRSRTSPRPLYVLWPGSCAKNAPSGASGT